MTSKAPRGPKSDKLWADAVRKAVHDYHVSEDANGKVRKVRHLNALAKKLVEMGLAGDSAAMREIGDRLDGKPAQATELAITVSIGDAMDEAQRRVEAAYSASPPMIDVTPEPDDDQDA